MAQGYLVEEPPKVGEGRGAAVCPDCRASHDVEAPLGIFKIDCRRCGGPLLVRVS